MYIFLLYNILISIFVLKKYTFKQAYDVCIKAITNTRDIMKGNIKDKKPVLMLCYVIMIITVVIAVVFPGFFEKYDNFAETYEQVIDASSEWKYEDGSQADLCGFNRLGTEEITIYHKIPQNLPDGTSLCFSSRNIFTKVYVNDRLSESIEKTEYPFYTKSPATLWHYVQIPESAYGGEIKIVITNVYNKNCTSLNDISFCNSSFYVLSYIKSQLFVLSICSLMMLAGIAFIIVDLYAFIRIKKEPDVFYLGIFSFMVSIWSVCETRVAHLFITDGRIIQIFEMYTLSLIPIPMLFYLKKFFNMGEKKSIYIIFGSIFTSFIISTVLALVRVADLQNTVFLAHFNLILTILLIFWSAVKKIRHIKKEITLNNVLYLVGLIMIIVSCSIDIFRFYFSTGSADAARFIRIGLLFAILCYGTVGIKNIINKVDVGIKSEIISKLAYQDGLTGIGNRTAYQEKIDEYSHKKNTVLGIVMFDVNNLKYINDVYGHKCGDKMIVNSAEIIKKAFSDIGSCYRIGGDEFAVIIDGDDVSLKYNKSISLFNQIINEHNKNCDIDGCISIAYGMAIFESGKDTDISCVCELADKRMYKCKAQIKANQACKKR